MRNEIFARYGHSFRKGGKMDNYFRKQDWYKSKNLDATNLITKIEKQNITLISTYETNKIELEKNDEKNSKSATITGTDIIIRNEHSTKSEIIGSFKKAGEKVVILETYTSKKQTVLIKNKTIVIDREGEENTLQDGKSVKIIAINEESPIEILISFKNKKGEIKEGLVSENDLDYINESWYQVKRDNGEIGWVFGKFIKMI
jgi:hypothetical protein